MDENNFADKEKLYGCANHCTYVLENDKDEKFCFKSEPGGLESKCLIGNTYVYTESGGFFAFSCLKNWFFKGASDYQDTCSIKTPTIRYYCQPSNKTCWPNADQISKFASEFQGYL